MRRNLLFFPVYGALALCAASPALAGTVVKLTHSETPSAALSSQAEKPAGWKYLPGVDLYIVDEQGQGHLSRLKREGIVAAAEDSFDIRLESFPDDPLLSVQGWAKDGNIDIGALEAWSAFEWGERTTVAIIDTGIDTNHPDLAPNLWTNGKEIPDNGRDDDGNGFVDDVNGYNFWHDSGDVTDENNHGSHMAGIIGAVGDNGIGVAGVDWNVRLMALRFTDARGSGTSSRAIEAIDYAIRNGAKIINASWTLKLDDHRGQELDLAETGSLLNHAIQKAADAGVLFVTAAGNQFRTDKGLNVDEAPVYPASFRTENMISVAAVDFYGSLASYSNFGPETVDIAAPGGSIVSTSAAGDYVAMSGTSMAAAFVSGAAALVFSADPDLKAGQVKAVLEGTVTPSDSLEGKISSGGLVNLFEAVSAVSNDAVPEPEALPASPSSSETIEDIADPNPAFGGCNLVL